MRTTYEDWHVDMLIPTGMECAFPDAIVPLGSLQVAGPRLGSRDVTQRSTSSLGEVIAAATLRRLLAIA